MLYAQTNGHELTTIIFVRHAEKVDNSDDPDLSEEGYHRVKRLSDMFKNVDFHAIYSTDYIRTKQTVLPIAKANELNIREYNSEKPNTEIKKWLQIHRGETILISGHSNSTPSFANAILGNNNLKEVLRNLTMGISL